MRRMLLLLVVVLLAGCGSDNSNNQAAGDTTGGGSGSVELTATDFKFDPSTVELAKSGQMTFTLVNDGQSMHALEIEGQGIEEKSDEIDGGATTELTVDLKPGKYEFYCPVDGHRAKGMEGTLVVGGAAGGTGTTSEQTDTSGSSGYGG